MKLERLLSIVVTLLNKEKVQAAELADKYEVSVRTIYRDIEAINMAGIPVVSYPGNNGGFGIMKNYSVERQFLSLKEMLAIATALKGISSAVESEKYEETIAKIENMIPKEKRDEYSEKRETLIIDMMPWGMKRDCELKRKEIEQAIEDRKIITFKYVNYKGEEGERSIEPMTLVYKGNGWYLYGYCVDKEDYRLFKLTRMKYITITSLFFIRREKKYVYDGFEDNMKRNSRGKVKIRFANEVKSRVEEYFSEKEMIPDGEGHFLIEGELQDDDWFYSAIFAYGEMAEVIEPLWVREKIKEKIEKIGRVYKTKTEE